MSAGAFTVARHFTLSDTVLGTGTGHQDITVLKTDQAFRPLGVHVNSSSDQAQETAGYAMISGYLYGENESFRHTWRVPIGIPVGLEFKRIYSNGTTARGISLLGQV